MEPLKVLNLYAGLGGNRKLWRNVEVTAVEIKPDIAKYYKDHYPNDTVIVGDAHQFLVENYSEFDFIWSSFPCQTHSRSRFWNAKGSDKVEVVYPDFGLYEEIVFLNYHFTGKWVVENVLPYYGEIKIKRLKPAVKIGRHYLWSNFEILAENFPHANCTAEKVSELERFHNIYLKGYTFEGERKDQLLRNCVNPKLGLHILNESKRMGLFSHAQLAS